MRISRPARIAAFALSGLGLTVVIALVVNGVASLPEHPCATPPPLSGSVPQLAEVGASLLAAGLGRLLGAVRVLPRPRPTAGPGTQRTRTALLLQAGLVAFLLIAAVLLWYETFALNNFDRFWPITFYVRCANHLAGFPTLAGAVAISFLFGHWFWPPATASRGSGAAR